MTGPIGGGEVGAVAVSMRDAVFVGRLGETRIRFTVFMLVVMTFLLLSVTRCFGKTTVLDRFRYFEVSWASFQARFPSFIVARASLIGRFTTVFDR
jgi:hypothetical protein